VFVVIVTHVAYVAPIVPELASLLLKFHNSAGEVPENKVDAETFELKLTFKSTLPVLLRINGVPPTVVFLVPPTALSVEL
jgi:hypothetical protein